MTDLLNVEKLNFGEMEYRNMPNNIRRVMIGHGVIGLLVGIAIGLLIGMLI